MIGFKTLQQIRYLMILCSKFKFNYFIEVFK